ncbi:MAG: GNAT family N-acetyltransferase, partial [Tepidisphaeraceae bacterium]
SLALPTGDRLEMRTNMTASFSFRWPARHGTPSGMIDVRRAEPSEVIDLRHVVLRAGLGRETAIFPGDDAPGTIHVVATQHDEIVGCATMIKSAWDGQKAWQVRGMAVTPRLQRAGVGRAMLEELQRLARASDDEVALLWCNARSPAVGFYERQGWVVASDEFVIETAGPHFKMTKRL